MEKKSGRIAEIRDPLEMFCALELLIVMARTGGDISDSVDLAKLLMPLPLQMELSQCENK